MTGKWRVQGLVPWRNHWSKNDLWTDVVAIRSDLSILDALYELHLMRLAFPQNTYRIKRKGRGKVVYR